MTTFKYNPKDFFIQLSPLLDDKGNWVGEIDINLIVNQTSPLKPEEFSHVKELAEWSLRAKENSSAKDTTVTNQPTVVESEDNVITLDFSSHKKKYDA